MAFRSDEKFNALVKKIGDSSKVAKLGRQLGFKTEMFEDFVLQDALNIDLPYMGTRTMLSKWMLQTQRDEQIPKLKAALIQVGLRSIADDSFPGTRTNPVKSYIIYGIKFTYSLCVI